MNLCSYQNWLDRLAELNQNKGTIMNNDKYNKVTNAIIKASLTHDQTVLTADHSFCLALADATEENVKQAINDHNKISTKLREFLMARRSLEQLKLDDKNEQ